MRITLLTYGSRGDVEPFVALAQGFLRAGHTVRLAAPTYFSSLIAAHEIDFVGLPGEPQQLVQDFVDEAGKSPWRMIHVMSKFVVPLATSVLERIRTACRDADVIVHSFLLTSAGYEMAREMDVPDISVQLFPVFSTTAEFPSPPFPDLALGDLYRRLSHKLVSQIFWQGSRYSFWRVRRANPHLSPLTGWPFDTRMDRQTPILYAFSSHVIPRPKDWRNDVHITGYWFSDDVGEWRPSEELLDFLNAGPAPISIVFGSTISRNMEGIIERVLEALAYSGQRGIVVAASAQPKDSSSEVFQTDYVPYGWLFPRMSAVVHHGGAGTTGVGLKAGVPNIVVPFTSDQPFWGRRVYALGAGPKPIPARNLSAKKLAEAIISAVGDEEMRQRAKTIGEHIRTEDGVSKAVDIIQRYVERTA